MKHPRFIAGFLALVLLLGLGRVLWRPLRLDRFGNAEMQWSDFVHVDGRTFRADTYVSDDNTVEISIVEEDAIGEKLGEVRFTMDGKVKSPEYELHEWDASYLPKGTGVFSVTDQPNTVAVLIDDVYYRYKA